MLPGSSASGQSVGTSLQRSGLLVCKFATGEDFNLTWPGGQTKQSLLRYVERSIRINGGFGEGDLLEIEVACLEESDQVSWRLTTLEELLGDSTVNIVRVVRQGDPRKNTIAESASKVRGLKQGKRSSMNQAKYIQLMSGREADPAPAQPRCVSREELKTHNSPTNCWISYKGRVYDITRYLEFHPGGKEILLQFAGQDISNACSHFHNWVNCERILQFSYVGNLAD